MMIIREKAHEAYGNAENKLLQLLLHRLLAPNVTKVIGPIRQSLVVITTICLSHKWPHHEFVHFVFSNN